MDFTPILNDDCLLLIFDRVPLQQRLTTLSLVCRRWAKLQPFVRKMVTSMTLLFAAGSSNHLNFESPFQLEEKQNTIITERPDLLRLCFTSSSLTNDNVLKAADLPNIRRLTIVQLMDDLSLATAIILPLIEQLAGQLTSFSFHYKPIYIVRAPLDESVVSAGLQRLLAVVNYQMFRLRHLLLNIDFDRYYQRELMPSFFYCEPDSFDLMGSLYLPVLRRLASFCFHSKCDHIELLHYSLRTFAASNHRLRLRLVMPSESNGFVHENDPTLWVWDEPVLQSQLEHLVVKKVSKGSCLKALSLPFSSLTSLYLGCLDDDKPETLMFSLFTALSSLPLLTTLQLDLQFFFAKGKKNKLPLPQLPQLPSVTSLKVRRCFDHLVPDNSFEALLAPIRLFPALCRLTLVDSVSYFVILKDSTAAKMPFWVGNSFRMAVLWRTIMQPMKLHLPHTLQTITIEMSAGSEYRKAVFGLDDL